jgi:putative ATP-binding cassette transporter
VKFVDLVRAESRLSYRRLTLLSAASGLTSVALLAIINEAAGRAANRDLNFRLALMFGIAIVLYVMSQRAVMVSAVTEIERMIHRVRVRLIGLVQQMDFAAFEHVGHGPIYGAITRETSTIAQSAPTLVAGVQSATLIVFAAAYVAALSFWGFLIGAGFAALAILTQLRRTRELVGELHRAAVRENQLFDRLSSILAGFKELKMSSRRAQAVYADVSAVSSDATEVRVATQGRYVTEFVRLQVMFLLLPAAVVFLVPQFTSVGGEDVMKMTASVLFLIGPIMSLGQSMYVVSTLNVAADNIIALERQLTGPAQREPSSPLPPTRSFAEGVREIALDAVTFQHRTDGISGFVVGPVTLGIRAGEMVFISGGNGSGKSTLIKVLAGLYRPTTGVLRVDGLPLAPEEYQTYRDRISVLFSDYHLFDRLYGVAPPSPARARELLEFLGMESKTRLIGDRFETLNLSIGQRKRLSLMVALLEDKPVMIFDEWAAEQDPVFRARFYREILPGLKRAGKTLIVVTHDDRYFDVADRHLRMEDGVLV